MGELRALPRITPLERAKAAAIAAIEANPHLFERLPHRAEIRIDFGREADEWTVQVQSRKGRT